MNELRALQAESPGLFALFAGLGALALAVVATAAMRGIARRLDFVSRPRGERWSTKATPMGGGVALMVAIGPGLYAISPDLLVGCLAVFLLGLVDDARPLSPPVKLVMQTLAACWIVAAPLQGSAATVFAGPSAVVIPITIAWYVGVANSVNFLDNMDGSAAGVTAVIAAFVVAFAYGGHDPALVTGAAIALGSCVGFLVHNFPPARIYMGDAGSLLLGFTLAGLAAHLPLDPETPWRNLAVPLLLLGGPLSDTTLVWFTRRAARRPFLQGGRDHTTHRLMALGLTERRTLLIVYGVAAALCGVALAVARGGLGLAVPVLVLGGIGSVLIGLFLGEVKVYPPVSDELAPPRRGSAAVLYAAELAVDVALLSAAWIAAFAIRFEDADLPFYLTSVALPALPLVIGAKVLALLWFDLYRGFWRTIRFKDVTAIVYALTLGTLLVVVVATLAQRFENYSRAVFAFDWFLSLAGVLGSRSAFRFFRDSLRGWARTSRTLALWAPAGFAPLVEVGAAAELRELDLPADVGAEALLAAVDKADAVLIGYRLPDDDPRLTALRQAGVELRPLSLEFDPL
ncbi:MAG: hypothetical protein R3F62_04880 [Planctomycetota bacterium]